MRMIVLFNLKPEADPTAYERWARAEDMVRVRALSSVADFQIYQTTGLFGGGQAPYQYIEVIDINSLDEFGAEVSTQTMAEIAAKFQTFADDPKFILTQSL